MVELDIDDTTQTGQIVLRPNASGTWRFNLVSAVHPDDRVRHRQRRLFDCGAWMILPFSIIEMGALAGMHVLL